jgi:hypothetical protein
MPLQKQSTQNVDGFSLDKKVDCSLPLADQPQLQLLLSDWFQGRLARRLEIENRGEKNLDKYWIEWGFGGKNFPSRPCPRLQSSAIHRIYSNKNPGTSIFRFPKNSKFSRQVLISIKINFYTSKKKAKSNAVNHFSILNRCLDTKIHLKEIKQISRRGFNWRRGFC